MSHVLPKTVAEIIVKLTLQSLKPGIGRPDGRCWGKIHPIAEKTELYREKDQSTKLKYQIYCHQICPDALWYIFLHLALIYDRC